MTKTPTIRRRKAQDSEYPYDHRVQPKARKAVAAMVKHVGKMMAMPKIVTLPADESWDGFLILSKDGQWWTKSSGQPRFFPASHKFEANTLAFTFEGRVVPVTLRQQIVARVLPLPAGKGKKT